MKTYLLLFLAVLFYPFLLSAQTPISGTINADQTLDLASSPYELTNDLTVAAGVTLTIEPGVELWFPTSSRDLIVNGTLKAEGTAGAKIRFWGNNISQDIHGGSLLFNSASTDNVLDHVIIEKMGDLSASRDAGIYVDVAPLSISNTSIIDTESGAHMRVTANTPGLLDFDNNSIPYVNLINGSVTSNATWTLPDVAYLIEGTGNLTIPANVTLTLPAGMEIWFNREGNDIEVNGTLVANGTASNPIRFWGSNTDPNIHGGGINFHSTSIGNILNHTIFEKLGDLSASRDAGIYADRAEISISNTTILDTESGAHMRVTINTPGFLDFDNNNIPYVNLISGSMSSNSTWTLPDVAYVIEGTGNITVPANVSLTLPAGMEIWFNSVSNDIEVSGTLIADGTAGNPIRFFGSNDEPNNHGGGVNFYSTSTGNILDYVIFEKLGDLSASRDASIYVDQAEISISNCTILDTESGAHMRVTVNSPSNLDFENNTIPYVNLISGSLNTSATWNLPDVAYVIEGTGNITVPANVSLTLPPGMEIWFNSVSNDIDISGTLIADGTASNPIRFFGSNVEPNNHGGGVNFYSTSTSNILNHAIFEKLGDLSAYWGTAIYVDRAEVSISNSTISDTESGAHMRVTVNSPENLNFENNNIPYVHLITGSMSTDATWALPDTAYVFQGTGNLTVPENVTLTLPAGMEIWFNSVSNDIDVSGTLIANGTETNPVRFYGAHPDMNLHGGGVNFYSTSTGNILNHAIFEKLGDLSAYWDAAVYVDRAEVSLSNSTILDTESGAHMRVTVNSPGNLSFENNAIPFVHVNGGSMSTDATWALPDTAYVINGSSNITVPQNVTLNLVPGTEIRLNNVSNDIDVSGTLIANGTESKPIRFYGGHPDINLHGGGVNFYATSIGNILNHTIFEKLGDLSAYWDAAIYVDRAELSISNSTITDTESGGHMRVTVNSPQNLSFENNAIPYVSILNGTINESAVWPKPDISYALENDLAVQANDTLTLVPGTEFWFFQENRDFWVSGTLLAEGTPNDPIRFFGSNVDPNIYGGGLFFLGGTGTSILNHVSLERLGGSASYWDSGIYVYNDGALTLSNSQIINMEWNGIRVGPSGTATIVNNCFAQIGNFGLFKDGSEIINAPNNYWGDPSGPTPPGQGVNVSTNVVTAPWLEGCESTILNDLSVIQLNNPTTGCAPSNTVSLRIANVGSAAQSNFQVGYSINGEAPVFQLVSSSIASGEILDVEFDNPVDLTTEGTYNFEIFTSLSGDENTNNDVLTTAIEKLPEFEIEITANTSSCAGDQLLITASYDFDYQYQWSNGSTNYAFYDAPTETTTYTVTVTNSDFPTCVDVESFTVEVLPKPEVPVAFASANFICQGSSVTISVVGLTENLIWNNGESGPILTVTQQGWYQVTHVGDNGCSTVSEWLFIGNDFVPYVYTTGDGVICGTETETICVVSGESYLWSNGETEQCITVNPTEATTYSVTVTTASNCVSEHEQTIAVSSDAPPEGVSNMLPPDGVLNVSLPVQFSWAPGLNATHYDVYIWEDGATEPNFPTFTTTQITVPYFGFLEFSKTYNWKVCARNDCSTAMEVCSSSQQFTLNELPDLITTAINAPMTAFSGTGFELTWEVSNIGNGSTNDITNNGLWYDVCYLSVDSAIGTDDTYLGAQLNPTALPINGAYTSPSIMVDLPNGIEGEFFFIVCADRYNYMPEADEQNNCRISTMPINIQLTPPPDLVVEPLPLLNGAAGGIVLPGESYEAEWTVRNRSNGVNSGPTLSNWWYDRIYLSTDTVFNAQTVQLQATVYHNGNLEVDETYDASGFIHIPNNATDTLYYFVCTDANNREYEYVFENNNCRRSGVLTVPSQGVPDFEVTNFSAPDTASNRAYINVAWTGVNNGADYTGLLVDQLYFSDQPNFSGNYTSIGYFGQSLTILNGESYERQATAQIPSNQTGKFYLLLKTNSNNTIAESDLENNVVVDSIIVLSPNLIVDNIVDLPDAISGQTITFEWTLKNIGVGDFLGYYVSDKITLKKANGLAEDLTVSQGGSTTLFAGETLDRQKTVTLPNSLSGDYFIEVHTNYTGFAYENGQSNDNVLITTDTFHIGLADYPNLIAEHISTTTTMATAGDAMDISFSVENGGDVASAGSWTDRIYLSTDPTWPLSNAVSLQSVVHSQVVPVGEEYMKTVTAQLSTNLPAGNYYLYLQTNAGNSLFENGVVVDNVKRSEQAIDISIYPLVDLRFTSAPIGPSSISPGENASIYYTVQNNGTVATTEETWTDGLYLSPNPTWEPSDLLITEWQRNGALNPGQSYEKLENFTLPAGFSNAFYLCLVIDHENAVSESDENNNDIKILQSNGDTITISYPPKPDLTVVDFDAPGTGIAGQPFNVNYTIRNISTDGDALTSWTESVYLSTDTALDGGDQLLGQKNYLSGLAAGTEYSDNLDFTLPLNASGNYFLLIKTDGGNNLSEKEEANNIESKYVLIDQPPSGDLVVLVDEIEVPTIDTIATDISISWQVSNIGQNPLSGYMEEGVYLSQDEVWDASDIQLGVWSGNIALDPFAVAEHSITARLENVKRQNYYVFVKTDLLDHFLENDETNNCVAGPTTVFVEVPELPLGFPETAATLDVEKAIYYRIEIPLDTLGETMRVRLTGVSDEMAFNELYLRLNEVPTRTTHDFAFGNPFDENQEILVPAVEEGTYYVMAYAVDGMPNQQVNLVAEIIPFAITSIEANKGGNTGTMTALLRGAKFEDGMSVSLDKAGLGNIPASEVVVTSSVTAFATFPLSGEAIGFYDVKVVNNSLAESSLIDGFEIVTGTIGNEPLLASCSMDLGNQVITLNNVPAAVDVVLFEPSHPSVVRPNQIVPITLRYENTGDVDVPVPSRIFASINGFPLAVETTGIEENLQELPLTFTEPNGPTNVLRPGGVAFITVYSKATESEGILKFKLFSN